MKKWWHLCKTLAIWWLVTSMIIIVLAQPLPYTRYSTPPLLSFEQLQTLTLPKQQDANLMAKTEILCQTPFLSNEAYYQGYRAKVATDKQLRPLLRVLAWNIDRGTHLDDIILALTAPKKVLTKQNNKPLSSQILKQLKQELALVQSVDLLLLTEVDMGMPRTGYRNVVAELAAALHMNYVYGVEFIELAATQIQQADTAAKQKQYLGLHGSAILSRYPIKNASLHPFAHQPFDWFIGNISTENDNVRDMQKLFGKLLFGHQSAPKQLRRGGRMLLLAELALTPTSAESVTVAVTHLESSSDAAGRRKQLKEVLNHLYPVRTPIILGGDFNTSGLDRRPASLTNADTNKDKTDTEEELLAAAAVKLFQARLPNVEQGLFLELARWRNVDGYAFDFRGEPKRALNRSTLLLSNSNEAKADEYLPTFELPRTLAGVGKFKIDWILVRGYLKDPFDLQGSYLFAPQEGRTLSAINHSDQEKLSDHSPLLVDIPLKTHGRHKTRAY